MSYFEKVDNKDSLSEMIIALADLDSKSKIERTSYVVEECSELIKSITKKSRGVGSEIAIFDEACDVLLVIFILLYEMGATREGVTEQILYKAKRALDRYRLTGGKYS